MAVEEKKEISKPAVKISGLQKVAALLVLLGPEIAGEILKHLSDSQIEKISAAIVKLGNVTPEQRSLILDEFRQTFAAASNISYGGVAFAKHILEKSLGPKKAEALIDRFMATGGKAPFEFIKKTDPMQLVNFIQSEHPQTIALVLAYLDPGQAAVVLSSLPAEQQVEVIRRVATMDKTAPEIIKEVEEVLERKLSTVFNEGLTATGGVKVVAEVLNMTDRSTEKNIFKSLEDQNPELCNEIKKLMFMFEDIVNIDDRGIQQILKEVDNKELAMALKTSSEDVKQKIFKNMSKRAGEAIQEEMEYMGPVRLRQVEESQQRIVSIIRKLEEAGEIIIMGRGGSGDEMVE
jgi:flagellar motor switch protein FliG